MKRIKDTEDKIVGNNENDACETTKVTNIDQNSTDGLLQNDEQVKKPEINLKTLHNENDTFLDEMEANGFQAKEEIIKISSSNGKDKIRAVVNLKMMKEELQQLDDPITPWEKEVSSK